jgi:aspartyl-tRNA(Asn)/glutamyl-tRNA(Gln) amidotransferase subunit A
MTPDFPTIADAARLIRSKKLSPVELTEACLARAQALSHLDAFITLTADRALAQARAAEQEIMRDGPRGPLHGIPVGLKDIVKTRGLRTTGHSHQLVDHVPDEDAAVTERLADAGTVLLGKLATHEFAFGGPTFDLPFPPARNPWDRTRFTGGSSSGTGAAVAGGMILGGIGTDTLGSIRGPSAFCGITGIKPTFGRVSVHGIYPLAYSLDHAGPMARTALDCAIMLQALAGPDPRDPNCSTAPVPDFTAGIDGGIKGLRIGVVRHFFAEDNKVSDTSLAAIDQALDVLRGLGAEVREVRLAPLEDWYAAAMLILLCEAFAAHEPWLRSSPELYGGHFRSRVRLGAFVSAPDYVQATRRRRELAEEMAAAFEQVDVLVSASTVGEAPLIDNTPKWQGWGQPSHNAPFNVSGAPALSTCCGYGKDGMPLAIQLAARPFEEALLLRVAHAYEQATPWRERHPPEPVRAAA